MGALIWPDKVVAYLVRTGRKPAYSAPAVERRAARQAEALLGIFERAKFRPASLLDIGSGLAVLDVLLARALAPLEVHLLDARDPGERCNSYRPDTQAWAEVEVGEDMFRANVERPCVTSHYAGPAFRVPAVDMVLSSRSWGHHYPIEVYAKQVAKNLKPGGVVVTDIRNRTDGREQLARFGFKVVEQVPDPSQKCERLVFVREGREWAR